MWTFMYKMCIIWSRIMQSHNSNFLKNSNFSIFSFLPAVCLGSNFSTFCQPLLFSAFIIASLVCVKCYLLVILICISWMTGHSYVYFLWMNVLKFFAHFLIVGCYQSSLSIGNMPLPVIWFQMSSFILWVVFTFFTMSFEA